MYRGGKGQVTLEFFVTVSIIFLVFIVAGFVVHQKYVESAETKTHIDGNRMVRSIADNINTVSKSGDGYFTYLTLPGGLYGYDNYTIEFYRDEAVTWVRSGYDVWTESLITSQIECGPEICDSTAEVKIIRVNESLRMRIENKDGIIWLSTPTTTIPTPTATSTTTVPVTTSTTTSTTTTTTTITTTTSTTTTSTTTTSTTTTILSDCASIDIKTCSYDSGSGCYLIDINTSCDCDPDAIEYILIRNSTGDLKCSGHGSPCGSGSSFSHGCTCSITGPPCSGVSCGSSFTSSPRRFNFYDMSVPDEGTYTIDLIANLSDGTVVYSETTTVDCVLPSCSVEIVSATCEYIDPNYNLSVTVNCSGADLVNVSMTTLTGGWHFGASPCSGSLGWSASSPSLGGTNTITATAYDEDGILCDEDSEEVTCSGGSPPPPPPTTTTLPALTCSQECQAQGYSGGSCKFFCSGLEDEIAFTCSSWWYDCCCTGGGGDCNSACQAQGYSGGSCKFSCISGLEDEITFTCSPSWYDCCCTGGGGDCSSYSSCNPCVSNGCEWCDKFGSFNDFCTDSCSTGFGGNCFSGICKSHTFQC